MCQLGHMGWSVEADHANYVSNDRPFQDNAINSGKCDREDSTATLGGIWEGLTKKWSLF